MTRLLAFGYLVATVAAALAWGVSRSRPAHRPVAALLTFGLAADLARRALREAVLAPAYAVIKGAPATGWIRAAGHLDQALFLAWPAGIAAAALWICLGRRPWPIVIGYALAEIGMVASYPTVRGAMLRMPYLAIQLACLAVSVGAFAHWILFRKTPVTAARWILALVVTTEMVSVIAGPWHLGLFASWDVAQAIYAMLYSMLVIIQVGWLWTIKNSR